MPPQRLFDSWTSGYRRFQKRSSLRKRQVPRVSSAYADSGLPPSIERSRRTRRTSGERNAEDIIYWRFTNEDRSNILLTYGTTERSLTGHSTAELLMRRKLKTTLSPIHTYMWMEVLLRKLEQKLRCDQRARMGPLPWSGQTVFAQNFRTGPSRIPRVVLQPTSLSSVKVELSDGTRWNRHGDNLRERCPPHRSTENNRHVSAKSSTEREECKADKYSPADAPINDSFLRQRSMPSGTGSLEHLPAAQRNLWVRW